MQARAYSFWRRLGLVLLTFSVTLVAGLAARAAAPACLDIFAQTDPGAVPIDSLYDHNLKPYDDDYGQMIHRIWFWHYHDRFGFTRTSDGRIMVTVKDKAMGQTLIDDLAAYTGNPATLASPVTERGWIFSTGYAYDVTALLPDYLRLRLEQSPELNGQNCFGSCLFNSELTESLVHISGREIREWRKSPYVTEITDARNLQPGDILIVDGINASGGARFYHAAIYVSPRLVITKNSLGTEFPIRLMDVNEMADSALYIAPEDLGHPDVSRKLSAYRFKNPDQVLLTNGIEMPVDYFGAEEALLAFEKKVEAAHDGHGPVTPLFAELNHLEVRWLSGLRRIYWNAHNNPQLTADQQALITSAVDILMARFESLQEGLNWANNDRNSH